MKDNEIIKALECCGRESCNGCPYRTDRICHQGNPMIRDSLALIKRQKAEIERLKKTAFDKGLDLSVIYKIAKDKAIIDFAKQVKMELCYEFDGLLPSSIADRIDNIVKEMIGEQE